MYGQAKGGSTFDIRATASLLGSIGAVTALLASASLAYVIFWMNSANGRKHDLYFRLKAALFDFDKFLRDYSNDDALINRAEAFSYDLKGARLGDFPLRDWEERIAEVVGEINKRGENETAKTLKGETDPHIANRILGYLDYFEDLISEIGTMCVMQIITGRHIAMVAKALSLVALLLLVITSNYLGEFTWLRPALYASPVFFSTCAILLLVEVGYQLYREGREQLTFVDWGDSDDDEKDDDDKSSKAHP